MHINPPRSGGFFCIKYKNMGERFVPTEQKYVEAGSLSPVEATKRRIAELKAEERARETIVFSLDALVVGADKSAHDVDAFLEDFSATVNAPVKSPPRENLPTRVAFGLSHGGGRGGGSGDEDGGTPTFHDGAVKKNSQPQKLTLKNR